MRIFGPESDLADSAGPLHAHAHTHGTTSLDRASSSLLKPCSVFTVYIILRTPWCCCLAFTSFSLTLLIPIDLSQSIKSEQAGRRKFNKNRITLCVYKIHAAFVSAYRFGKRQAKIICQYLWAERWAVRHARAFETMIDTHSLYFCFHSYFITLVVISKVLCAAMAMLLDSCRFIAQSFP